MDWNADFAGLLPDGPSSKTQSDYRDFILALPRFERARWERAVTMLLKAAELDRVSVPARWVQRGEADSEKTAMRKRPPLLGGL